SWSQPAMIRREAWLMPALVSGSCSKREIIGQGIDVSGIVGESVLAGLHEVPDGADFVSGDDRQPGAHHFVNDQSPGLIVGGQDENISCRVEVGQLRLVSEAQKMNVRNLLSPDVFFQRCFLVP